MPEAYFVVNLTKQSSLQALLDSVVDRHPNGNLTVRTEPGPAVEMTFQGAGLPRRQKSKLRKLWHAGISDTQRLVTARNSIFDCAKCRIVG